MEVEASQLYAKLASLHCHHVRSYLDYLPQEDHVTISHQAIQRAFRWLYARQPAQP